LAGARAGEAVSAAGARFVSLVGLHRPEDVPAAIVRTLGIVVLSSESTQCAVERFLATKEMLLVVDNFEHLLAAASVIGGLLEACAAVTALTTSREPLALHAEQRYSVSPLALPPPGTSTDVQADAVALFADRARARDPAFVLDDVNAAAVAEICRRVDGLPLGIELAAARCGMLSAGEIAERLDAALGAVGAGARDAPARQQTLRATIDWSHDLLSDGEKVCFARFAVFAGSADVGAAETITAAGWETLDRLVSKSLLVRRGRADASSRLLMLETIRAYADECFATADQDAVRERHYRYYLTLAERHGSDRALWGKDGNVHLAVLDADIENLYAALTWAVGRAGAEPALAMCAALGTYWLMRDRYADAVAWIDRALALPDADAHPSLRVDVLCSKVWCLWPIGRASEGAAIAAEAEAVARELGDPGILSRALQTRAEFEAVPGRLDVADALADEALLWADAAGDEFAFACASCSKAIAAATPAERRDRVDRAASLLDEVGCAYLLADLLGSAGQVALQAGSDRDARELLERAMPVALELDNGYIWMLVLGNFGLAALLTGDADVARDAFRHELTLCRELVVRPMASEGLRGLAAVAAIRGDVHRAARLVGAAAAHQHGDLGYPVDARLDAAFFELARAHCGDDAWDAAAREGAGLSFDDAIAHALEELPA
jgi:predicted ATPase